MGESPSTPPSTTGTVLVVDDDLAIRVVVARRFRSLGFDVIEAGNGQEAIDKAGDTSALRLVVSDWEMPKLDGVSMAKQISQGVHGQGPPAILLTARDFEINDEILRGTNVVEVMRKPFSGRKLVERALQALQQAENPAGTET